MAQNLSDLYPGRVNAPDAAYPGGSIKNETTPTVPAPPTTPGSNDGTPLDKDWANDHEGFLQSIMAEAGISANGLIDNATASQRKDALKVILSGGIYETTIDFPAGSRVKGSDFNHYDCLTPNGPGTSVVDPVGDTTGTWVMVGGILHVVDEKVSGTAGGSSVAGYQTRTLNTVKENSISGSTLSANQITLPPGRYQVSAFSPVTEANRSRVSLYNVTAAQYDILGSGTTSSPANNGAAVPRLDGLIDIASSTDFELRHYCEQALVTSGLGFAMNDGEPEQFAQVIITRL